MSEYRQAISDNYFSFTLPLSVDRTKVDQLVRQFQTIRSKVSKVTQDSSDSWQVAPESNLDRSK